MAERDELEALFLAHLGAIDRLAAVAARRQGLRGDEAVEFAGRVRERLVADDYAVLRKYRGEAALTTFLHSVVTALARDFRVQLRGRWRTSAAARRIGPPAVRLEMLVRRDGYALREAGELLRTNGETTLSDRDLAAILAELPLRDRPRSAPPDAVEPDAVPDPTSAADDRLRQEESDREHDALDAALGRALERLPYEDRVILAMRYWNGSSIADIARALRLEQRPLYRRIERLLTTLRRELEAAGVTYEQVRWLRDEPRVPVEAAPDEKR